MILRTLIRWTFGIDVIEAVERAEQDRDIARASAKRMAEWHKTAARERDAAREEVQSQVSAKMRAFKERDEVFADAKRFWTERDAARDQVAVLTAELETLRKTNAMFRSLIGILRDVNRELDERNVYLEKLHGMTPGERLEAIENDALVRCTKSETEVTACHQ